MFGLFFALIPGILKKCLKTYSLGCRRFSLLKCGFILPIIKKKVCFCSPCYQYKVNLF